MTDPIEYVNESFNQPLNDFGSEVLGEVPDAPVFPCECGCERPADYTDVVGITWNWSCFEVANRPGFWIDWRTQQ